MSDAGHPIRRRRGKRIGNLTPQQRHFMLALQFAVSKHGGPVSVQELTSYISCSDSRIRSHLNALTELGFLCCVGKTRRTMWVPSRLWLDEPGVRESTCTCVGGACEHPGCNKPAEVFFQRHYLCREHMIGDDSDGRDAYYKSACFFSSSSGWDVKPSRAQDESLASSRRQRRTKGKDSDPNR
jgi:hypothetical protein